MGKLILEFLEARIAEDEAIATAALWENSPGYDPEDEYDNPWSTEHGEFAGRGGTNFRHILHNNPGRVLAECAAKRAIMDVHHPHDHGGEHGDAVFCDECQWDHGDDSPRIDNQPVEGFGTHPCRTLALLAAAYKDHPDYAKVFPDRPQTAPAA